MASVAEPDFEPADFWQTVEDAGPPAPPPYAKAYPARLGDSRRLWLPIRPLGEGRHALASLIVNQASFAALDALVDDLAQKLRPHAPDLIVGLPTLGLTLASELARKLGHARYAPLGTSRKFWYSEELSVPLSSITTPEHARRLYLDPRLADWLRRGRRVAIVDDVISTGASMAAGLDLLARIGVAPVVCVAAMTQSERWIARLGEPSAQRVVAALRTPILERTEGGWREPAPS